MYATMLMRKAKSWFTGYNSNVPGHEHGRIRYFVYNGPKKNSAEVPSGLGLNGLAPGGFSGSSSEGQENETKS